MHAWRVFRLVAIATLVVVASIAVGAASRPHSVDLSPAAPQVGEGLVIVVFVLAGAMGLMLGANLLPIWVLDPKRGVSGRAKKSRIPWGVRVVLVLLPLMALVFLVAAARTFSGGSHQPANLAPGGPITASDSASAAAGDSGLALACIVVALTGFLVAALLFRSERPVGLQTAASQESVAAILDEGLGALISEHDPRKAVIAAYVAMERAMARKGWARRPHEAPTEYLARVLGVAPSRAQDLDELVSLYELARFSEHTVTPAMRNAAVESVKRLRAELQEPV